ncbi:hypothetical protein UlMin_029441 [Ulmus minor]
MSDGVLTILDGSHLRAIDHPPLATGEALTGAQVLDLADSVASSSLFGLSLPQSLKSSAFQRINIHDVDGYRGSELAPEQASRTIELYISAIADELKDNPLVVAVLDGSAIRLFLEDEDDFAMIAENIFTELDEEDKGKIRKSEIPKALLQMGVEMGVPPISEFPLLNDILKKHKADAEEELGQAQFAQLLQYVLQELAEALAENHVVLIQKINIINGSKLRKVLADEKQLSNVVEKILQENRGGKITEILRTFLEKNGSELGVPPSEANEAVVLLYEAVFGDMEINKSASEVDRNELSNLLKAILEKFAEQLEANPVFA